MQNQGVMVVTSIGHRHRPISKRAIKNKEYAATGKATLIDLGLHRARGMPEYLLEQVGRYIEDNGDIAELIEFFKTSKQSHKIQAEAVKSIRTQVEMTQTFKVTLPREVYESLWMRAMMHKMSISKLIEIQSEYLSDMEKNDK